MNDADAHCRICRAESAPGLEFCRPCAVDLALLAWCEPARDLAESSAHL